MTKTTEELIEEKMTLLCRVGSNILLNSADPFVGGELAEKTEKAFQEIAKSAKAEGRREVLEEVKEHMTGILIALSHNKDS